MKQNILLQKAKIFEKGIDKMAMYMLHNLKPYAIEIAEGGKEKSEPEIDIDALLSALFG